MTEKAIRDVEQALNDLEDQLTHTSDKHNPKNKRTYNEAKDHLVKSEAR